MEKVVGRDLLIPVSGASLRGPDDVWNRVLDWMDVPNTTDKSRTIGGSLGGELEAKGSIALPFVAKGEAAATGKTEVRAESSDGSTHQRRGLQQVVDEIGGSEFVVLLDDFHYMDRAVQAEVAKTLKEAVRLGVKIVTAAVSHRGDDVVRANPELRGRVRAINLRYWADAELEKIATVGFGALNAFMDPAAIQLFVRESAGSPQLMQLLCLQACFVNNLRTQVESLVPRAITLDSTTRQAVLEQTSATTDFRSLVDVLDSGPRTRGTERKTYKCTDGTEGDVYRVVLKALASDPPQLSFPYDELLIRTAKVCIGDPPVGSSVTGTCLHMSKLALDKFPNERAVDWDEQKQVFDIPDPYLLFYLRWSARLKEPS
ncbi:MAG TPA: hypothetical protein VHY84_12515 [Bryobacteraceae bacterium]|nr:hypothetical protein [Bryobacteraceae bacterium]